MIRRTQKQWYALFKEQKHSGLTQTKFCKRHDINPKYFSLRKSQLTTVHSVAMTKAPAFIAAQVHPRIDCIEIDHQRTHIKLPSNVSADWVAQFVLQLGGIS